MGGLLLEENRRREEQQQGRREGRKGRSPSPEQHLRRPPRPSVESLKCPRQHPAQRCRRSSSLSPEINQKKAPPELQKVVKPPTFKQILPPAQVVSSQAVESIEFLSQPGRSPSEVPPPEKAEVTEKRPRRTAAKQCKSRAWPPFRPLSGGSRPLPTSPPPPLGRPRHRLQSQAKSRPTPPPQSPERGNRSRPQISSAETFGHLCRRPESSPAPEIPQVHSSDHAPSI